MMAEQLTSWLFVAWGVFFVTWAGLSLIGATFYDARQARLRRQRQRHPQTRSLRRRPLVTVMVSARNDQTHIEACLQALLTSSYKKLEIIIIDHASSDATVATIRRLMARHSKRSIRLVARRQQTGRETGMRQAWRRYGHGELVCFVEGSDIVDRQALRGLVDYCNQQPELDAVIPRSQIRADYTLGALFQKYLAAWQTHFAKAAGRLRQSPTPGMRAMWRASTLQAAWSASRRSPQPDLRIEYASQAVINVAAMPLLRLLTAYYHRQRIALQSRPNLSPGFQQRITKLLRRLAIVALCLTPLLVGYFVFLALKLQEPTLLGVTAVALGMFVLATIWEDDGLRLLQKIMYTAGLPLTYGLFFFLSFTPLLSLLSSALPQRARAYLTP